MKKIRTKGELEAITRFMYETYKSSMENHSCAELGDLYPYDDLDNSETKVWRETVESLLNHLETVEELELKK